jgi:hypothetical protein
LTLQNKPPIQLQQQQVGARLAKYYEKWKESDKWVSKVVKNGLRLPFMGKAPRVGKMTIDSGRSPAIMSAIQEFLEKGALEPTKTKGFTSRFFVEEKGEKIRPILDCRPLNKYLKTQHFKMEDLGMLASIVQPEDYLVKIDLKDAYLHVPIHKDHRKYLQVYVGGQRLQFRTLPFGLNAAPQVFTRILKAALLPLRKRGIRMTAYLDDICVMADSEERAREHGRDVVEHLQSWGFIINQKKTCLVPRQEREFLGFMVNTKTMTLSVPTEKAKKIKREARVILAHKTWPMQKLSSTIGLMSSVCRAMKMGTLMIRALQADLRKALYPDNVWSQKPVKLSPEAMSELAWWSKDWQRFNGRPLKAQTCTKELWTDASGTGWGAVCQKEVYQGKWTREERKLTSNQKECLAVLKGLHACSDQLQNAVVRIHSDNMTTVSNISRQGGAHSKVIIQIIKTIWRYALSKGMWLAIQHIKGIDNILADQASRSETHRDEYYLTDHAMEKIKGRFGTPTVDLFANRDNRRCLRYVTREQDAFQMSWKDLQLPLIHPPVKLIPRVLQKINEDQVERAILVIPEWRNLPYFPMIQAMQTAPELQLKREDLILSPDSRLWKANALSMIAVPIGGHTTWTTTTEKR